MRYETPPDWPHEPVFEVPPALADGAERRLTMRLAGFGAPTPHEFCDTAVTLAFDGEAVAVVAVGETVAAAFGLRPGPLDDRGEGLAARLHAACAALRVAHAVVAFEAAVPASAAACVLLRGVVLPTQDGAEAVLSWKEVLDRDATARLRAELLRALARPRAKVVDAFANS